MKQLSEYLYIGKSKESKPHTSARQGARLVFTDTEESFLLINKKWVPAPIGKSLLNAIQQTSDHVISKDIPVTGVTDLGVSDGHLFQSGTKIEDVLEAILNKEIAPSYTDPELELSKDVSAVVEIGALLESTLTSVFTQNDAGSESNYQLSREVDGSGYSQISTSNPYQDSLTVPLPNNNYDLVIRYQSSYDYGQGPLKQTNLGNDYPTGRISAGTIQSDVESVKGVYPWFYGTSGSKPADGSNVYSGNKNVEDIGNQINAGFSGSGYLWFAVPKGTKVFDAWEENALNSGNIGNPGDLFQAPITVSVTSTGLATNWTKDYDLYVTENPTNGVTLKLS